MTLRAITTTLVVTGAVLTGSYQASSAGFSFQGSDYSRDFNSKHSIENCDEEADSTSTKGIYDYNADGGSDGNVSDQDGANGICASKSVGGTIARHRTCENPNWWPDTCGNWAASG